VIDWAKLRSLGFEEFDDFKCPFEGKLQAIAQDERNCNHKDLWL